MPQHEKETREKERKKEKERERKREDIIILSIRPLLSIRDGFAGDS